MSGQVGRTRMAGETFGNYEVVATLGKGGMGVVFLAEHQRIARSAAIKVLAPSLTTDPDVVKRFFKEARATSLIRHPGIVEVFDCDVDASGRAYIVMEYLEGETLAACLRRVDGLPWRMACAVGERIACAVGAAHGRGIVHRDLKPDNVFLCNDDAAAASPGSEIKILDFGIAKLLSQEAPTEPITRTGMVLGTPLYMSPEQCGAATAVDHRTDVYSLGCILFEMICGRPPFVRDGFRALLMAHMFQPPPLASTLVEAIPAWLDQLIARMLAKTPDERPASMAEIAAALSTAGHGEGRPGLPVLAAAGRTLSLPAYRRRPRARFRRPGIALAGAVGGLAALAAVGGIALSRAPPTKDATATDDNASTEAEATPAIGRGAPHSNDNLDSSLASTVQPRRAADPVVSGLATGAEPDSHGASVTLPAPSRPPPRRRLGPTPTRLHAESPRVPARLETDGIVDL